MANPSVNDDMEYRRLGASGLRVSVLSFGSWVTFGNQLDTGLARDCIDAAGEAGCNFFDNAEVYAGGASEQIMGKVFHELGWPRWSYVLTTKAFWGIHKGVPNMNNTLNRKYLMQSIDGSLDRLQTDFVDVFYCHRADPETPMEEVVFTMSEIVSAGKANYWGTSEWTAEQVREAMGIAESTVSTSPSPSRASTTCSSVASTPSSLVSPRRPATATRSGAPWLRACSPASTATASPRIPVPRSRATTGSANACPTPTSSPRSRVFARSLSGSTARWLSWLSPGARSAPTSRP